MRGHAALWRRRVLFEPLEQRQLLSTVTATSMFSSIASVVYGTPVTFTAAVSAQSGTAAPTQGSVAFLDSTTHASLGAGTFGSSSGTASTWTLATTAKSLNVTSGDTITATYTPGAGFLGSSGTTSETVTTRAVTVTAAANVKIYDGTTSASATPIVTSGSLVTGDTPAFSENYDTKNAGIGKLLTPTGSVNDGNSGNNYAVTFAATGNDDINPLPVTVTAVANTKAYDGTMSASEAPTITPGLATGDTSAFSESYNDATVGTAKTLIPGGSVNDGNGGANYSVTFAASTAGAITQTAAYFLVTATPSSITAGGSAMLTVTVEDGSGKAVTNYGGTVHFTSSDPLEPLPAANFTFTPGSGVAYVLATLETAGSWSVTATDTVNSSISGVSNAVSVGPASASKLGLVPPGSVSAGGTLLATAYVEDPYGNLVSTGSFSTATVTVAIASGPNGGKLLGTTSVQAVGGVATFGTLSINQAGSYTLIATASGLLPSSPIGPMVTPGAATQLAFATEPANTPGANTMTNMKVAIEDQYGNTVTTDGSSVTLSLNAAASGGGGVLKGTLTKSASGGVATFSGLSIVNPSNNSYSAAGTGYTLSANDTDVGVVLTAGKSTAFNTTLIVNSCTMTPTGFVATFSQPIDPSKPNLYSAQASGNLPANVELIGSVEGSVRGSLVLNATDTQITFVATTLVHSTGLPIAGVSSTNATSGILAPDGYTVVLDSGSTAFVTTNGQLLDGNGSGTGGTNFNQTTTVNNSADVDVVIPSFARGPSSSTITSTVNVLNVSTPIFVDTPLAIAPSTQNGATESGNTVTITTSSAHGLVTGQAVLIAGFTGVYAGYNGTYTLASVPSTTTFTYTDPTSGLGKSGSGTVTGYGLTESGSTVTVWTTVAHDLAINEPVTISGAGVAGYNGTFTITSLPGGANGTTFTYTDTNTGLANAGGGTAALARGIPISLSGAKTSGVTSGTFTLTYSSSDLAISGAVVDPALAASYGATLSLDASSTPGNAIIDFSTTTALPSASTKPILLGGLVATVPSTAYYKAKDLLHFSSVTLKSGGGSVTAIGTDALHLVTFAGNASGSGAITSGDGLDLARVVAGADAGFAAYPMTDPDIIGDLLGDGAVDGPNGAALGRYINGATVPQMPLYPGAPANVLPGPDPTVSIPPALTLAADGTVTVPVNIDDPHPAGSAGMTQATLAVSYDPAVFSVSSSDIHLGSVPASGSGWTLESTLDAASGQIGVTIWSATPIASSAAGSLVTIVFHRTAMAASGTTSIDLVNSADPDGSGVIFTQVDDVQGPYTLTPAPSDVFDPQIDGLVSLAAAAGPASAAGAGVVAGRVSRHVADRLFTALGRGAVGTAELAIAGYGAEPGAPEAWAAQTSAVVSAQANLDRLLWESGDSSWQDDKRPWLG
jgi:hypothetical protein